ncbi:zinc-ribbon domain-containing protein, partial [Stutzerimonas stutzeri]
MTSFITQCPNCSTRFRISRSQLRAAHGAVRCGACLEVFNAVHHLLRD